MLTKLFNRTPAFSFKSLWENIHLDRINYKSAAFAYYALVALVPLLVIILFIGGLLVGREAIQTEVIEYFTFRIGEDNVSFVQNIITQLTSNSGRIAIPIVFFAVSLIGLIKFFTHLRSVFFEIFDVAIVGTPRRQRIYMYTVTFLTACIFIVLFTMIISSHIMTEIVESLVVAVVPVSGLASAFILFDIAITFLITIALLTLTYRLLSCYGVTWRHALYGALSGAGLFVVLNVVLSVYFRFVPIGSLYGTGGALIAFLIWVYMAGYIFFFGAEIAKTHRKSITCNV